MWSLDCFLLMLYTGKQTGWLKWNKVKLRHVPLRRLPNRVYKAAWTKDTNIQTKILVEIAPEHIINAALYNVLPITSVVLIYIFIFLVNLFSLARLMKWQLFELLYFLNCVTSYYNNNYYLQYKRRYSFRVCGKFKKCNLILSNCSGQGHSEK